MRELNQVLIINGFNYLSEGLIFELSKRAKHIYLVDRNITPDRLQKIINIKNVEVLAYQQFFKNDLRKERYDLVLYNTLYEGEGKVDFVESISNAKSLLNKSLIDLTEFYLISSVNENKETTKFESYLGLLTGLFQDYTSQGVHGKLLRLGDIYGPGMDLNSQRAINTMLLSSLKTGQILLEGSESFSYLIYIDDAIKGILHSLDIELTGTFTIADPFDLSKSSIGVRISEILQKPLINKLRPVNNDHFKNLPYILPNWRPEVNVEKGLENTILWIKESGILKSLRDIELRRISNDEVKPKRNYESIIDQTQQGTLQNYNKMNTNSSAAISARTRSLADLKQRIGDTDKPEPQYKEVLSSIATKLSKNTDSKKSFGDYYGEKKDKKSIKIFLAIILLLIIIFLLLPIGIYAYGYVEAGSDESAGQISKLSEDVGFMRTGLNSLQWIFIISGQTSRFNNALQTNTTLADYAQAKTAYDSYIAPINNIETSLPKQDDKLSSEITALSNNNKSTLTQNYLEKSLYDFSRYNPYYPGNLTMEKSDVTNMITAFNKAQILYNLIPVILQGQTHFLVVIKDSTSTTPLLVDEISFTDGVYGGITPLKAPQKLTGQSADEVIASLEKNYSGSFNGGIIIDKTAVNTLTPNTQINDNAVNGLVTAALNPQNKDTIKSLITNNDIQFSITNIELSNSDIMNAIF